MTEGTVKLFSVIDIDCSDPTYCFGVIGNGSAFCIKKKCSVKTHLNVKMSFAGCDESVVFIRRNIPGSVFTKPKLSRSKGLSMQKNYIQVYKFPSGPSSRLVNQLRFSDVTRLLLSTIRHGSYSPKNIQVSIKVS